MIGIEQIRSPRILKPRPQLLGSIRQTQCPAAPVLLGANSKQNLQRSALEMVDTAQVHREIARCGRKWIGVGIALRGPGRDARSEAQLLHGPLA